MEKSFGEDKQWITTVLKSIGDGVVVTDAKGCITFMNPVSEDLTGWEKEETLGKDFGDVFKILDGQTRKSIGNPIKTAIQDGSVIRLMSQILVGKNKAETFIDDSIAPLRDSKENIVGAVLVFHDISEHRRAEKELRETLDKLKNAMEATIQAMAFTIENRDPYTAGHQQRVAKLATAMAEEMGLLDDQIEGVHMSGLIHDLGKISTPAEILSKPGLLSEMEFGLIKTHPKVGFDILKTIEFPWPVAQIVLQHHERINGSGYLSGLKDEEILIESKILGVADVVEAMASHRPYRPALGIDTALEELSQQSGILYDSVVVDTCLEIFNKKGFQF